MCFLWLARRSIGLLLEERRIGDCSRSSTNRTRRYEEESRSSKLSCEYYFDGFPSKTPQPFLASARVPGAPWQTILTNYNSGTRSGRPMTDNPYKLQLWNAFRAPHDVQPFQLTTSEQLPIHRKLRARQGNNLAKVLCECSHIQDVKMVIGADKRKLSKGSKKTMKMDRGL